MNTSSENGRDDAGSPHDSGQVAPAFFITGTSRSGTGLMEQILKSLPSVTVVRETHYFDDLRPRLSSSNDPVESLPQEQQEAVVRYFGGLRSGRFGWVDSAVEFDRGEFSLELSADDLFVQHGMSFSEEESASIWGEKTPRHVFRISEILECFPNARVIHMVRDPRAVLSSYKNWASSPGRFQMHAAETSAAAEAEANRARRSYNIILNGLLWRSALRNALRSQSHFGSHRVRIVRYEDLVKDPEEVAESVARWLGIGDSVQLDKIAVANSSFSEFKNASGVTSECSDRWMSSLTANERVLCECLAGDDLEGAGYSRVPCRTRWLRVPVTGIASVPGVFRAVMANRGRLGNPVSYVLARLRSLR